MKADDLIRALSAESLKTLQQQPYHFMVPEEFRKDKEFIKATIIDNQFNIRYRREIIDIKNSTCSQITALNELEKLIYSASLNYKLSINKNNILLLNNRKFLHGRTKIIDPDRHLIKIRFSFLPKTKCNMFVQDTHHEVDSERMANIRADNESVLSKDTESYVSAPLLVPPSLVTELSDFYAVLIKIIHQVVKNYFDDDDINSVIEFENERILKLFPCINNNKTYQIGVLRPDFIISHEGSVKLRELNARFVCNGIICSKHLYPYYANRFNLLPAGSGMLAKYLQMFDLTKTFVS